MMQRVYAGVGWVMVALGLVHIASTTRFHDGWTEEALWFVGGGLAIVLTGVLNLLNRSYGRAARGLRLACGAANLVMTAFALASGLVGRAPPVELLIVVGLFGGATALSMIPNALWHRAAA